MNKKTNTKIPKTESRCIYKDRAGYCRHKKNQERGASQMKCCENGCPYVFKNETNIIEKEVYKK